MKLSIEELLACIHIAGKLGWLHSRPATEVFRDLQIIVNNYCVGKADCTGEPISQTSALDLLSKHCTCEGILRYLMIDGYTSLYDYTFAVTLYYEGMCRDLDNAIAESYEEEDDYWEEEAKSYEE